jgi:hypothetical protein
MYIEQFGGNKKGKRNVKNCMLFTLNKKCGERLQLRGVFLSNQQK